MTSDDSLQLIRQQNEELARQINDEALSDPNSPNAGKFVGIVRGRVECASDDLDEVAKKLHSLPMDAEEMFIVEASRDCSITEYIWDVS